MQLWSNNRLSVFDPTVQPSRDDFWRAHIALGFAIFAGEAAASVYYFEATSTGPARATLQLIGVSIVALAMMGLSTSGQLSRLSWREQFVSVTSIASTAVLVTCAHLDGGLESPLLYLSALPVLYLGLFVSPRYVVFSGVSAIAGVAAVGLTDPEVAIPQESLLMLVAVVTGITILAVGSAVHRSRLQDAHDALVGELFRRGHTDELTGCANYRAFHGRLADEIDRAIRYQHPLSLLVCDVDNFRTYNDQYGHDYGDATLAAVGALLRSCARSSDGVARVGGDEFGILLPETALDEAATVAQRITRGSVSDPTLPTLSVGVAELRMDQPTAKQLFRDADQALYAAKKAGRARATVADEELRGSLALVPPLSAADDDQRRDEFAYGALQQQGFEVETLLGALVEEAIVGFAFIDEGARLLRINKTFARLNDREAADYIGRPIAELGPLLWSDIQVAYQEVLRTGCAVRNVEITADVKVDAAQAWLVNLFPVRAGDQLIGVGVVVLDITDRKRLEHAAEALTESVTTALAAASEARDPYTAGHQIRVSDISVEIAARIGLNEYEVKGIALAASIHDIGKVGIPAEILSRPGKLTEMEMQLVRTHAEVGYNILRDIDFPWPVAEMVLQHHERLDGTGYPQGLHADDILLGSRIIAVADVVEAMSAHRPYRAALGLQQALDYIRAGRGVTFDAAAVDACIQFFASQPAQSAPNAA